MKTGKTLYFDYQASTPVDPRVFEAMAPYFGGCFANPHSADHAAGWRAAQGVESAGAQVAALIGADSDEIVFTSGATESNSLALLGLSRRAAGRNRNRILVSAIEHKSVLAAARAAREQLGYEIGCIPVDRQGRVEVSALEQMLGDDVLCVSVMAVNNEIGTIQDVERISEIMRSSGAVFHCDGAQAPPAIDLKNIVDCVDLLSLSGHKMYGPQGIGALFVRRSLQDQIEPLIYGGGQQHGLRSGTAPVPLCVGMGAAAELLASKAAVDEREELRGRMDRFVEGLNARKWAVALNSPEGLERHPGNANMRFEGFLASDVLGALQPALAASTGSACTSGIPEPSHVLRAIGLSEAEAESSIRFSIGRGTTDADVDEALGLVDGALSRIADQNLAQRA